MSVQYTLQQLAELVGGQVEGDGQCLVHGMNGIEYAGNGELTFVLDVRQLPLPESCQASACIVPPGSAPLNIPTIVVAQPSVAAADIHRYLLARPFQATGIHPTAVIGTGGTFPGDISIGALVYIGNKVTIGHRVCIHPGAVIEDGVSIGDDTVIHANVTIAHDCTIGNNVILYHGAVIGSDGFGFATDAMGQHHKKPQVGTVRIDDGVEIGANSCVDRAAFGVTWIQSGVHIDNLVMVGHNAVIGPNSVLVAQVGIAGSSTLGRNVVLGGQAAVAGHLHIGNQVMVAARGGVHNNQPDGAVLGGAPAFEAKQWGRATAVFQRLPDMMKDLRRLRKEVEQLQAIVDSAPSSKENI